MRGGGQGREAHGALIIDGDRQASLWNDTVSQLHSGKSRKRYIKGDLMEGGGDMAALLGKVD